MSKPSPLIASVAAGFTLLLLPFLAFCFVSEHQPVLPAACDEFGYLQLAHAFDEGFGLGPHANRPFEVELVAYLRSEGVPIADFAQMIAPHAYHFDSCAGQLVNQYPPATSYLLSWFPKAYRYAVFPPLCALLLVACLLAVFWWGGTSRNYGFRLAAIFVTASCCLFVPPLDMGFDTITSIGPTYGLLIAAGFLLRRHPGAALILLGATTVFRVANIVLAAPFLVWFIVHARASWNWRSVLGRGTRGGVLFGSGGFFLFLLYTWLLLGNPFRSTYSQRDTDWSSIDGVRHHLEYYFNIDASWMWLHGVVLTLMFAASLGERRLLRWALFATAIAGFNYAFYLLHAMPISYYPYASALVMIGMLLDVLDGHPALELLRRQVTVVAGAGLLFLLPTIRVPTLFAQQQFEDAVRVHRETLDEYDVVWAGLKSGTAEYAADTAGFRYFYGPVEARVKTVRWLRDHGYEQAIWIDELSFDRDAVVHDFESNGIPYIERRTRLGSLIVIQ